MKNNSKVLVLAAHPDDIEPQMGGLIAQLIDNGSRVRIAIFTIPNDGCPKDVRVEELFHSTKILNCELIIRNEESGNLKLNQKLITIADKIFNDFKPTHLFFCSKDETHQDHLVINQVGHIVGRKTNCNIFEYSTILPGGFSKEFNPNWFVDITKFYTRKKESIAAYSSQIKKIGKKWLRDIEKRDAYYGSKINVKYAEGFKIIKLIT